MVIVHKGAFIKGLLMAFVFIAIMVVMFSPLFGGKNAFERADWLFNSIAKGSSYYIPQLKQEIGAHRGKEVQVKLELKSDALATQARTLLERNDARAGGSGRGVEASFRLGELLAAVLGDADGAFQNKGAELASRYGFPEKEALNAWWLLLKEAEKDLKRQEKFAEAAIIAQVMARGVEVAYNFYGIEARRVADNWMILVGSLLFYLLYTIWWGYAIMFLFDGVGLQMKKAHKKEV